MMDGMITECDLAYAFVEKHKTDLRFACKQAQWFINTPEGWERDDTNAVLDLARQFCRKALSADMTDAERLWLGKYATIRNVLWLARSYRSIAVATMPGSKNRRTIQH